MKRRVERDNIAVTLLFHPLAKVRVRCKNQNKIKKKSKTEETHTQLENMALQEALNEINRKLEKLNELDTIKETMATKQDIKDMREEFERAVQILNKKVEVLEVTVFELEKNNDGLTNQVSALKESNNDLIKKTRPSKQKKCAI